MKSVFRVSRIRSIAVLVASSLWLCASCGGDGYDRILVAIDSDPAMGISPITDPEDAYALALALRSPRMDVLGIGVNFANASLARLGLAEAMESARRLLAAVGREDVPLYWGAESSHDLGKETQAVAFLLEVVRRYPGQVTVISLGSLTATATAMMMDPEWIHQVKSLVVMGGCLDTACFQIIPLGGFPVCTSKEFNVSRDVPAAQIVFEGAPNMTLVTLEFSGQVLFTPEDIEDLSAAGTPLTQFLVEGENLFQKTMIWALGGFILYDSLAVGYPLWPELYSEIEWTPIQVGDRGKTSRGGDGPLIRVPHAVDARAFVDGLMLDISRP